jgi:hypothetical protein
LAIFLCFVKGQPAVGLIAVDVNNALRISPNGGVIVGIGDLKTLGAAVAGDVVLREGTAVRIENNSRDATPRILSIDAANRLELGMDADDIKWGKPVVPLGPLGIAMLGTIGGSGPTQAAQSGWFRRVRQACTLKLTKLRPPAEHCTSSPASG